jgi:hypothetical protein
MFKEMFKILNKIYFHVKIDGIIVDYFDSFLFNEYI